MLYCPVTFSTSFPQATDITAGIARKFDKISKKRYYLGQTGENMKKIYFISFCLFG
jgi:hypothetical protein